MVAVTMGSQAGVEVEVVEIEIGADMVVAGTGEVDEEATGTCQAG